MKQTRPKKISGFWSKVKILSDNECWPWLRRKDRKGYGQLFFTRDNEKAHRVAFQVTNGPIPSGFCVLHHCDNPICCNPDHLFLGTQLDNIKDMAEKGRGRNSMSGATHCFKGHEYTPENSFVWMQRGRPTRRCKICYYKRMNGQ
jgi:hypothetical protein